MHWRCFCHAVSPSLGLVKLPCAPTNRDALDLLFHWPYKAIRNEFLYWVHLDLHLSALRVPHYRLARLTVGRSARPSCEEWHLSSVEQKKKRRFDDRQSLERARHELESFVG